MCMAVLFLCFFGWFFFPFWNNSSELPPGLLVPAEMEAGECLLTCLLQRDHLEPWRNRVQVVIRGDPLLWGSFHPLAAPGTEELAELFWLALAVLG